MRCCQHPDGWTARAQVWLGTLVEVALPAAGASDTQFAAAFAAIAHVHRTMSAHDATSDLARIALDAHRCTVVVDKGTYAVLDLAQQLFRESAGAFDVTIAPLLARNGVLPMSAAGTGAQCGRMDALRLEKGLGVRALVPIALDLGGIAKGFAVDRAVAALRSAGVTAGIVNAGGDLRAFGADTWMPIRVRHPANPAVTVEMCDILDAAVATSADYFRDAQRGMVDPGTPPFLPTLQSIPGSITVIAPTCALADALTKIVALRPAASAAILARHGAHAFMLDDDGPHLSTSLATTCAMSTANLRLPLAWAA
jgi:FAD:protein FMN transferase